MAGKRTSKRIGLRDRLGRLTFRGAIKLLGDDGETKLRRGGTFEINLDDVYIGGDTLRVNVLDSELPRQYAIVTAVEMTSKLKGLQFNCDSCHDTCDHIAAVLSMLLEEKLSLGLSAPPDPNEPVEHLTQDELIRRAIADREGRAESESMKVRSLDTEKPWTDYLIASLESGKTYRVSLRGREPGESYCSCPDFRTNHLGTCKHIIHTIKKVEKRFSTKKLEAKYRRKNFSLRLDYGREMGLKFNLPDKINAETKELLGESAKKLITNPRKAVNVLRRLEAAGHEVHVYPDAEQFIDEQLLRDRLTRTADEIRKDPAKHPLRTNLLNAELLPYQLDGIAFAVGAGRAVLADDMGLGKTIQGIGVAELFSKLANVKRVLVVCPASLKSQWRNEIERFSDRDCQIILGSAQERSEQYLSNKFFTICNYEQILRDHSVVTSVPWDLIILDEGQRIKNWESKTSQFINSLRSRFALVLSGTPLENRLEELYTVIQFVDERRLGPAYRFFHKHRIVDERGRVEGYKNLDDLRETLKPILLRRTRDLVMKDLPERMTEVVRIRATAEQKQMSDEYVYMAARIAAKPYLTEMDFLRLQRSLLMARMSADSTYLVDKEAPGFSSKLERLRELLEQLSHEEDRKIILFSEWTTMLNLIEPIFEELGMQFVRLDGKVPQKKRQILVQRFQNEKEVRAILMTNAGSTGLNLQAANTVINVDLPWNPAVLEQRIARAHRMGQKRTVQVFLLVTEGTIEERMLNTLSAKHDLALAALDVDADVNEVELSSGIDELKSRLEKLLGNRPPAEVDESQRQQVIAEATEITDRRKKVASAGGELLGAALNLVGELIDTGTQPDPVHVEQMRKGLDQCVERDEAGRPQLKLVLNNDEALNNLAQTLAKLLVTAGGDTNG